MNKIPENKTRKRLRTAMWVFYLLEIVLCSLPYYQYSMDGKIYSNSVFDMLSALGAGNDIGLPSSEYSAINTMIPLNFIFLVIPIVGFFFCVLDRKSNMKNIVSILCCLLGVVSILTIVTINLISLGSMLAYQSDFARLDARAAPLYLDQLSHGFLDLRAFLGSFRCGESC